MANIEEQKLLMQKIARVLDEARTSYATHTRKLKELLSLRSCSPLGFFSAFSKTLLPLFSFQRRTASAERIVRFVSIFASIRDAKNASDCDAFLEEFLRFLLLGSAAADRTARFRSCQIISEIIMRLPDDAEVSDELWDDVIECMKQRVGDKFPIIRTYAVRALSRFSSDSENSDILDILLQALPLEQNAEVRKTIVLSLPPSNTTSTAIIECTLDVSESVRKAAYCVVANKFPLQTLSIKLRTVILQRGLSDRSEAVTKECLKLLKDEWLAKCCNGDLIELLKFLDVETYESAGEAVMGALLKARLIEVEEGQSIRQFLTSSSNSDGHCSRKVQLMEAEVALYWRSVCRYLQTEAQAKGSDAAATMGTEAAVYAAEASDNNETLEKILPETVLDYVELVKAHLAAGPNYRFSSRQLLLLGAMFDFSDATNRKLASTLVHELLHRSLEHEIDEKGNKVFIGDGINLGGDRDWAESVSVLARKVHGAAGEFEEVVLGVVEELARPCRERSADFLQWMHCLSVAGLLLENAKSFRYLQRKIEPVELLQSLLLPGAKHIHLDVQRVAIRCLGLFGLLERKPSEDLIKQLRMSFLKGPSPISVVACKALVDLAMWHGPQEVDRAMGHNLSPQSQDENMSFNSIECSDTNGDTNLELLDFLCTGLDQDNLDKLPDTDESESVKSILGEGFAKMLLLSEKYPSISTSLHPSLLLRLISMYFHDETKDMERLKQCLSVFFEHYPSLSADHKKCLSKAFISVMRSMWPGINGNMGGSPLMVSTMRKRAIQVARFMLQMMQAPLYARENGNGGRESTETIDSSVQTSPLDFESGEEGLAIRIATEVARFSAKKTAAEKSYVSALCKVVFLLQFRSSEQHAIKLMRKLLNRIAESAQTERDLLKEMKKMDDRLNALELNPDEEFSQDQAATVLGRLELALNFDLDNRLSKLPTPAPCSTKPTSYRRRLRHEEHSSSDEETSPKSIVPQNSRAAVNTRTQRASKTAALTKMNSNRANKVNEEDDDKVNEEDYDDEDEDGSDVTSEEDSDDSS